MLCFNALNCFHYASENCLLCFPLCQPLILFMTKGCLVVELWPATCQQVNMQDRGDWVAVDDTILVVEPVTLLSDSLDSRMLAPWCCMFSRLLLLLMNIQFSANSTVMLLTALHCASIPGVCSYASTLLLCSRLCQHNSPRPNIHAGVWHLGVWHVGVWFVLLSSNYI